MHNVLSIVLRGNRRFVNVYIPLRVENACIRNKSVRTTAAWITNYLTWVSLDVAGWLAEAAGAEPPEQDAAAVPGVRAEREVEEGVDQGRRVHRPLHYRLRHQEQRQFFGFGLGEFKEFWRNQGLRAIVQRLHDITSNFEVNKIAGYDNCAMRIPYSEEISSFSIEQNLNSVRRLLSLLDLPTNLHKCYIHFWI